GDGDAPVVVVCGDAAGGAVDCVDPPPPPQPESATAARTSGKPALSMQTAFPRAAEPRLNDVLNRLTGRPQPAFSPGLQAPYVNDERSLGMSTNDAVPRAIAVVGLAGVALIHLLDAHDTFLAAPYKGWLYVALIAGVLAAAGVLI